MQNYTCVYGQEINLGEFSFKFNDDKLTKSELGVTLSTAAKQFDNAGEYDILAESSNSNLNLVVTKGTLHINPIELKIRLNPQTAKHFTKLELDNKGYEIIEGEIVNQDNLGIEIYTEDDFLWLWGEYELFARNSNKNYSIEVETSVVNVTFSYVDIAIISVIAVIILLIAVIAAKNDKKREDENVKFFNDALSALRNDPKNRKK